MKGRIIALLSLILTAGPAAACSYIVQTQVRFEQGSAELDRSQVIKLAEWLDRSYSTFSVYTGASVEAGASGPVAGEAKALAALRATNTVKALRMLLRVDLSVEKFSRAYRFSTSNLGENNDFASLQLYPDVARLKLPDCNPIPIPGFKY
jgi:hypothetical protein